MSLTRVLSAVMVTDSPVCGRHPAQAKTVATPTHVSTISHNVKKTAKKHTAKKMAAKAHKATKAKTTKVAHKTAKTTLKAHRAV